MHLHIEWRISARILNKSFKRIRLPHLLWEQKTKEVLIWMVLIDHPPVPAIFECCSPTCFQASKKTKEVLIWMVLVDHPPVPAIFECCSPTCFQAVAGWFPLVKLSNTCRMIQVCRLLLIDRLPRLNCVCVCVDLKTFRLLRGLVRSADLFGS